MGCKSLGEFGKWSNGLEEVDVKIFTVFLIQNYMLLIFNKWTDTNIPLLLIWVGSCSIRNPEEKLGVTL